ncbi:MAG: prepilin-type N-terminal cleavage/methylation domain-containing protein [candidate division WOR-3 bacterium]
MRKGFTLVEILVAIVILVLGVLAASQLTIISMRTNQKVKEGREAREIITRGMEVLKSVYISDPLVSPTCDSLHLNDTTLANLADSTNVVGRAIGKTTYRVFWNVADNYPTNGARTIRMIINNKGKRIFYTDYVKWR